MNETGILLFGGSFDPIHNGHLIIARAAAEKLGVEKVVLIPAAHPPHKDNSLLTPAENRLTMTRLAVEDDELFEVSDCELHRTGPSFTIDTIRYFRRLYGGNVPLYWLIGADSIKDLAGWRHVRELMAACTIVTAARPGCRPVMDLEILRSILDQKQIDRLQEYFLDTPLVDVSATEIRRRLAHSQTISNMVPPKVAEYIRTNKLYQNL